MPLTIKSIEEVGPQVSKVLLKGKPVSKGRDLSGNDIAKIYRRLNELENELEEEIEKLK